MDRLFNALMARRTSGRDNRRRNSSCGDIPDLYISKKRALKRTSFCSRHSPPSPNSDRAKSMSNSERVNDVDELLIQIRKKLAAFREQDTQFRERMNSLTGSVSELTLSRSSLSSFTPSECSDLGSLDEVSEDEESEQQTVGQRVFVPDKFNQPPARSTSFHVRQLSDPLHSHAELPEKEAEELETQSQSKNSATRAISGYPQNNNPEEISTLF